MWDKRQKVSKKLQWGTNGVKAKMSRKDAYNKKKDSYYHNHGQQRQKNKIK